MPLRMSAMAMATSSSGRLKPSGRVTGTSPGQGGRGRCAAIDGAHAAIGAAGGDSGAAGDGAGGGREAGGKGGHRRHGDGAPELATVDDALAVGAQIGFPGAGDAHHIARDAATHVVAAEVDAPAQQAREAAGGGGLAVAGVAVLGFDIEFLLNQRTGDDGAAITAEPFTDHLDVAGAAIELGAVEGVRGDAITARRLAGGATDGGITDGAVVGADGRRQGRIGPAATAGAGHGTVGRITVDQQVGPLAVEPPDAAGEAVFGNFAGLAGLLLTDGAQQATEAAGEGGQAPHQQNQTDDDDEGENEAVFGAAALPPSGIRSR